MTRDEAFEFLDRTARGIAEMFGSSCETLVHDMGVPTHPILSIYNGHVSGREVGSTMDIMGIGLELDEQAATTDQVNLAAATPDGRQTKSSTFHMIGEDLVCRPSGVTAARFTWSVEAVSWSSVRPMPMISMVEPTSRPDTWPL